MLFIHYDSNPACSSSCLYSRLALEVLYCSEVATDPLIFYVLFRAVQHSWVLLLPSGGLYVPNTVPSAKTVEFANISVIH